MASVFGQSKAKKNIIIADSKIAKVEFVEADALRNGLFEDAYGYVIFPNVGKAGFGIGGAAGNGVVYERGKIAGMAKLSQVSIGFQAGGQGIKTKCCGEILKSRYLCFQIIPNARLL
ncbi:hypothetical protein [Flavobacterium sandaracinum]|uniref:hypothetical protein n=1 Tax=Flavobacterium sandaracinum TaxID=2541733 RepID=UPI001A9DA7CE|nr:hypothetical protein [Flavobacterium sandaracinum]